MMKKRLIALFLTFLIVLFSTVFAVAESVSNEKDTLSLNKYSSYLSQRKFNPIIVAVIDSGVANIAQLKGKTTTGYDFIDEDNDASNDESSDSHGTVIASIIAEATRDLPIKIMPVRILDNKTVTIENIVSGIEFAVNNGASVINLSIGGSLTDCSLIDDAIEYANDHNVSVVVSAGNERRDITNYCPAHNESAITVSAVDYENNFANKFSNFGEQVDCCAPGVNIDGYSSSGEHVCVSGTSFSAAFISAGVSMLRLEYPEYSVDDIQEKLKSICVDLGEEGFDWHYGYGLPDFSKLIIIKQIITIKNDSLVYRYGETITLEADVSDIVDDAEIHWFINGIDTEKCGKSYIAENCKNSFSVQIKCMINGKIVAESQVENVTIKATFFDKVITFFRFVYFEIKNLLSY